MASQLKLPAELNFWDADLGTNPALTVTGAPTVVGVPEQADPVKYSYVTVPPALKPPVMLVESVTEPPTRIEEVERLVVIDGAALPIEIEIVTECDVEPLAPVTVTVKTPLRVDGQDMVEVPEPAMLIEESVQVSPMVGAAVAVRVTVPANPLAATTVKVEFPAVPTVILGLVGLAVTAKSCTVYVTVVGCDLEPLVPVTVIWTDEAELKVHERTPLPDPITLVGETAHKVLFVARLTVPAKPLTDATVMVEVPAVPAFTVTSVGFATTVKSVTVNVTVVE
jgi:hypothetical protein